jgi:hypothetical protein
MTRARPLAAILVIGLLEVIALGCLAFIVLVVALGATMGDGDPAGVAVLLTAGLLGILGVLAVIGGIGMWRGGALGWILGFTVGVVGMLGLGTAAMTVGAETALLVASVPFAGLVVLLLTPPVRRHAGLAGPPAR